MSIVDIIYLDEPQKKFKEVGNPSAVSPKRCGEFPCFLSIEFYE